MSEPGEALLSARTRQAAHNNAIWCDTLCRVHGAPGKFHDSLWLNAQHVPPFYPNAVTLVGESHAIAQIKLIQGLLGADLPNGWGVKDSFCALDLSPLGFSILFLATWIWWAPSPSAINSLARATSWKCITSLEELGNWEAAWNGGSPTDPAEREFRLFPPTLLDDPQVVIIAAYQEQRIVAGAIANLSGQAVSNRVVGLSNVFTPAESPESFWAGLLNYAQHHFPGLPLVGYEQGSVLEAAIAVGFEPISPLRVWIFQDTNTF